jgi:hypothetical protein
MQLRSTDAAWNRVANGELTWLDHDVLACVIAPEVEPRIRWLYQELQGGTPQPYPTRALLQELLGIAPAELRELAAVWSDEAALLQLGLIECDGAGPFSVIRPARGVTARLLGMPPPSDTPPGTTRVPYRASWDDLVLPGDRVAMMREYVGWICHRAIVIDQWAGRPSGGPVALFSGPSGTGKTLAASVIASELGWPLYRVDLGSLISKYIGETEKNLRRLFDAAEASGAILLFDEADALFGRRSEIKDSHDRYANIEVSYLLQRMEAYRGLAILTTNFETALDPAFQRRLRFSVQFPFPDPAQRERIWRGVFPAAAPLEQVDPVRLARLNVAGGSIRNIALHAAFLAAEARTPIGMGHLLRAARSEAAKRDRPCSEAETRGWV